VSSGSAPKLSAFPSAWSRSWVLVVDMRVPLL
jgi:hypothetical protein